MIPHSIMMVPPRMLKKVTWTNLAQADVSSFFFSFSLVSILLSNRAESHAIPKTCFFLFPPKEALLTFLCHYLMDACLSFKIPLQEDLVKHAVSRSDTEGQPVVFLCAHLSQSLSFDYWTNPPPTIDFVLHMGLPTWCKEPTCQCRR